jgi:Dolichyl-phosphate-mannose-protein mannosyltransferase
MAASGERFIFHHLQSAERSQQTFARSEKFLLVLFLLTLPFISPRVRGDGIGYYAFARSVLIDHNLQFKGDWKDPNTRPVLIQTDKRGKVISAGSYTKTGHLDNHFSVGPAMLWAPFLIATHIAVVAIDHAGWAIPADGFSRPYLIAMGLATALYGFLGLWISFRLARKYFAERWALLATLGIWFASSLPVYMYADPSWSHAHSAFAVALFVWYWDGSRENRGLRQWVILGFIAGLMIDTYYLNAILLLLPAIESVKEYREANQTESTRQVGRLLRGNLVFLAATVLALLPTLVTKKIIYGGYFDFGYTEHWFWSSPALLRVCFSAQHGLFSLTPILIVAVAGIVFVGRHDRELGSYAVTVFVVFLYAMGCYERWHGVVSFGNRFFVSLTPIFILGLAAAFSEFAKTWGNVSGATKRVAIVSSLLIVWNVGLVFQWSTGLLSDVSPVIWREVLYNQFRVVPSDVLHALQRRFALEDGAASTNPRSSMFSADFPEK